MKPKLSRRTLFGIRKKKEPAEKPFDLTALYRSGHFNTDPSFKTEAPPTNADDLVTHVGGGPQVRAGGAERKR